MGSIGATLSKVRSNTSSLKSIAISTRRYWKERSKPLQPFEGKKFCFLESSCSMLPQLQERAATSGHVPLLQVVELRQQQSENENNEQGTHKKLLWLKCVQQQFIYDVFSETCWPKHHPNKNAKTQQTKNCWHAKSGNVTSGLLSSNNS